MGLTLAFGNHEELGELLAKGNDNGASAMSTAAESNNTSAVLALHRLGAWVCGCTTQRTRLAASRRVAPGRTGAGLAPPRPFSRGASCSCRPRQLPPRSVDSEILTLTRPSPSSPSPGAKINDANAESGETPCYIAAQMGNNEMLHVFSQLGADLNAADLNGTSPLLAAVQEGHIETVRLLCEHGAEIMCSDTDGFTPVYLAAQLGNDEMVRVLHSLGADLEAPDNDGMMPVLTAAQENRVTVVRTLHALGADINTPDNVEGVSPLHIAAETGHAEMVSALIELGANAATEARDGNRPLWIAAHEGHLGCVRALCAVPGLLPDGLLPNASGISPAEAAAANGHAEVQAFLLIAANAAPSADSAVTGGNVDDEQDDAYESPFFPQSRRLSAAEAAGESADGSGQERRRTRTTDETEERDGGDDGSPAAKRTKR